MKIKELQNELRELRLSGASADCEINIGPVVMGQRRKTVQSVAFDEISSNSTNPNGRAERIFRNGIVYLVIGDLK